MQVDRAAEDLGPLLCRILRMLACLSASTATQGHDLPGVRVELFKQRDLMLSSMLVLTRPSTPGFRWLADSTARLDAMLQLLCDVPHSMSGHASAITNAGRLLCVVTGDAAGKATAEGRARMIVAAATVLRDTAAEDLAIVPLWLAAVRGVCVGSWVGCSEEDELDLAFACCQCLQLALTSQPETQEQVKLPHANYMQMSMSAHTQILANWSNCCCLAACSIGQFSVHIPLPTINPLVADITNQFVCEGHCILTISATH